MYPEKGFCVRRILANFLDTLYIMAFGASLNSFKSKFVSLLIIIA